MPTLIDQFVHFTSRASALSILECDRIFATETKVKYRRNYGDDFFVKSFLETAKHDEGSGGALGVVFGSILLKSSDGLTVKRECV